jgi:hypothetical protein
VTCPECTGPYMGAAHPSSVIVFSHAPGCGLGRAMDATQAADAERTAGEFGVPIAVTRVPTAAEVTLLAAVGVAAPTSVSVQRATVGGAVVSRSYG